MFRCFMLVPTRRAFADMCMVLLLVLCASNNPWKDYRIDWGLNQCLINSSHMLSPYGPKL